MTNHEKLSQSGDKETSSAQTPPRPRRKERKQTNKPTQTADKCKPRNKTGGEMSEGILVMMMYICWSGFVFSDRGLTLPGLVLWLSQTSNSY